MASVLGLWRRLGETAQALLIMGAIVGATAGLSAKLAGEKADEAMNKAVEVDGRVDVLETQYEKLDIGQCIILAELRSDENPEDCVRGRN